MARVPAELTIDLPDSPEPTATGEPRRATGVARLPWVPLAIIVVLVGAALFAPVPRLGLLVVDEGLGVAHGEQERIFYKFYRVDPQQTRGVGGTGLGLYISRELVRLMGGQLSVISSESRGSTFVVELPREPARETVEPKPEEPAAAEAATAGAGSGAPVSQLRQRLKRRSPVVASGFQRSRVPRHRAGCQRPSSPPQSVHARRAATTSTACSPHRRMNATACSAAPPSAASAR